jgi:predicted nucleotidyltransferase
MNEISPVLEQIVTFITSKINPERITLFGSYARGDSQKNCDIDILILVKNLENERKITGALYRTLLMKIYQFQLIFSPWIMINIITQ